MKKSFYLFTVLFFALAMMFTSPAMAHGVKTPEPKPTALPINGGIVFLMIAGVVVGIASVSKVRLPKEATLKA
jgi:phosphatidylserine synthase